MSEGAEPGEEALGVDMGSGASWTVVIVQGVRGYRERRMALGGEGPEPYLLRAYREGLHLRAARDEARHRADEARWRHGPHHPLPRLIRRAGRDRIPK